MITKQMILEYLGRPLIFLKPPSLSIPTMLPALLPILLPTLLPLTQMSLVGSVYTTLAVAVERYMAICQPYRSDFGCLYISTKVRLGFIESKLWL